jgi:hypothetical protein
MVNKLINVRAKVVFILITLSQLLMPCTFAHELESSSAQVILRDGQLEIRLYVNTEHWLESLQDPVAWLTGESDFTLDATAETKGDLNKQLSEYLISHINLKLDAHVLTLAPLSQTIDTGESALTEFRFYAQHSSPNVNKIRVQFPSSIGEVHISIVEPQYGLIPAGTVGEFSMNPL